MRVPHEGEQPVAGDAAARMVSVAALSGTGAIVGWLPALAALAAGYLGWGGRGVVPALTVAAFWLLLQFSRSLRVLRTAAGDELRVVVHRARVITWTLQRAPQAPP